jgi:hypothetical protein
MRGGERGPPNEDRGDCMGDGLLQSQFGANLHTKRANNRVNMVKGGEADRLSLTGDMKNQMDCTHAVRKS